MNNIESILTENRIFPPPADFDERIGGCYFRSLEEYKKTYQRSLDNPEEFWAEIANQLDWFRPWSRVLEWNAPDAKWFVDGETNICHNCIDRQITNGYGNETAIIWEGEPAQVTSSTRQHATIIDGYEVEHWTYQELHDEIGRCANALKSLGIRKGDVVTIYMGMVPELTIAMLACARIGAVHSIIFGGFSAQAIVDRVIDAKSRIIITCDGSWRRGNVVELKKNVDDACVTLENTPNAVDYVVVLKRCHNAITLKDDRDISWHDFLDGCDTECDCEPMDSEDMLFLLYTSGSTGKPKGIVHTTGGYMVYTYLTSKYTFNLNPNADHVYWCTADIGWITGHSYIVYGLLPNRVASVMYEGAPNHPEPDRFWDIVARHQVTQFYTAPTAIRAFMKWGDEHPKKHDLSSLKVLGTVGEPINPEAWMWYHKVIGNERCPIVDTWWQTETGGHMLTPLPGATPTVPGSCTLPFFGIDAAVVNEAGEEVGENEGGLLVIRKPWPSMLRGIYGDRDRFIDVYWKKFGVGRPGSPTLRVSSDMDRDDERSNDDSHHAEHGGTSGLGYYFAGDGARQDSRGYFWIMGRVDDVINVSGHRLGTMEVESALVSHPAVVEAAVVGMPNDIKGTGIAAFITLASSNNNNKNAGDLDQLRDELKAHVAQEIGAIAKPDMIRFTDSLPKTRSGKIMRRLLRDIAAGKTKVTQDTTTLEDYTSLAKLHAGKE